MDSLTNLQFNPELPATLHLDINSCFATIEQQANPLLRGKPVVVLAYLSPKACILASSVEAKALGIKTGMRFYEAQKIYPQTVGLTPDVDKYRFVHTRLKKILGSYTNHFQSKSIDEFVLHLKNYPAQKIGLFSTSLEIKKRIKQEVGEWLTVSIGIAPNRFLAKTASNLKKPDGLEQIDQNNFLSVYSKLNLTDLCGINHALCARLNSVGIFSVLDFYQAPLIQLKSAFKSVLAKYWYLRLRGWEIDDFSTPTKSFGHSFSPPHHPSSILELSPLLHKLIHKTFSRFYPKNYAVSGVSLAIVYQDRSFWHSSRTLSKPCFDPFTLYRHTYPLLLSSPKNPVSTLSFSCFNLSRRSSVQLDLFDATSRRSQLTFALNKVNRRFGVFTLTSAKMLSVKDLIPDRIGFGNKN
jgi:DNA polymerase-4